MILFEMVSKSLVEAMNKALIKTWDTRLLAKVASYMSRKRIKTKTISFSQLRKIMEEMEQENEEMMR
jgi:hypothetical protein